MLRTVNACIISSSDSILLVQRTKSEKVEAGKWSLPGGSVKPDETLEDALDRELREELAIDLSSYEKRIFYTVQNDPVLQSFYFLIQIPEEIHTFELTHDALHDFGWIQKKEIPDLESLAFGQKQILEQFFGAT